MTILKPGFVIDWLKDPYEKDHVRFGIISGDTLNSDKVSYAKQSSADRGSVNLHLSFGAVKADIVTGNIPKKWGVDALLIAFTEEEISKITVHNFRIKEEQLDLGNSIFVSFTLKWSYFENLHKAIDKLPLEVLNRVIPVAVEDFTHMFVIDKPLKPIASLPNLIHLDKCQNKALKTIMNCKSCTAPVLVIGSFGTGKTRLLARTAYQILQHDCNSRVLICAHHQTSADTFIESYFGKMYEKGWCPKPLRLIPNENYKANPEYNIYYCTARNLFNHELQRTHLVVTTFLTSLHLIDRVQNGFFTHILLDEGAQSREPESIAPLCLANWNTKIVIAGDHKQVS